MKCMISALAFCLGLAIANTAHSMTDAERYKDWLGEMFIDSEYPTIGLSRYICRADSAGYMICFIITDMISNIRNSSSIIITISTPYDPDRIKISQEKWPEISVDGIALFDMNKSVDPEKEFRANRMQYDASWVVVRYTTSEKFGPHTNIPDTSLNFRLLFSSQQITARVFLEDGSTHLIDFPLKGLPPVLIRFLPEYFGQ